VRCILPLALAGILALGACKVTIPDQGTNFACDATHACPDGYICVVAGYCAHPDWRCGMINVLADDFEDQEPGWEWLWSAEDGAALSEEGGQAITAPAPGGTVPTAAYYESAEWYEWTDARLYVEVTQSVNGPGGARAFLALVFDGDDTIAIEQEGDQLYFKRRTGGVETTLGSVAYDPTLHRWWGIRSAQGQTRWETAPDAFDWQTRYEETQLQPPGLARIRFGAAADAGVSEPGAAHFDNLNGGVLLGQTCRASEIGEDFEGSGTDGWRRSYDEGGAGHELADGTALVYLSDADASEAAFVSSSAYTLVNNGVSVEVQEVPEAGAGVSTWLRALGRGGGDYLGVRLEQDTLYFEQCVGGSVAVVGTVLHDPAEHRYWAIGHRDGQVLWSTSPDGQTWTTEVSGAEPFRLDTLTVAFGASAAAPPAGSTVARFDDLR
jgi:hypothetical protein